MVEVRLLGPVELEADGELVELGRPQQRLVLAVLAAEAGRVVAVETLIDRTWDEAPVGARRALQVIVTRLRRILERVSTPEEPVRLMRRGGGYVLEVDADRVDVLRYRRLAGERPGLDSSRQAVALWRGEPLSGLSGDWVARTRSAWRTQHLDTIAEWARAELRSGNPAAPVGPLTELVGEHPLTEPLTEVLMRTLHRTGRSADALATYETLRKRLAAELGVDPGPGLQTLHRQILTGAPATDPGEAAPVPRQLPAAVPHFVGRSPELTVLNGLLKQQIQAGGTVLITAIGGTAGVGKTALAVHWAQQVAGAYPDGQLYVNLRGFDATGPVVEPADAIRRFLDALQVPVRRIPVDLEARAALYRSELAGRRMLIVLDNARDAAQVRPLLPGAPTCLVIVTSRNQLRGLVAAHGAHPVVLDLLTEPEARDLLIRRLGPHRIAAEPEAVADIITRCARLPLALALVAARAAFEPTTTLQTLADGLRDSRQRWDTLGDDEPSTDLRTVFSWSYRALTPDAARLFRLLGVHPGPDISAPAAASLAGLDSTTLIDELVRAGLVTEHTHGRYTLHDLLRGYAADLAATTDTDRHTALHRMLDHYLHTANTADQVIDPARQRLTLDEPRYGVTPERLTNPAQALDWLAAQRPILLASIDLAAASGFDAHAWRLARTLHAFLSRHGHWHDHVACTRVALEATRRLGDQRGQTQILRNLAAACVMLQRFDEAEAHLNAAAELGTRSDDLVDRARTLHSLAFLADQRGRPAEALQHASQALELHRAAHDQRGQAIALNTIGWCHSLLGQHDQALSFCRQALALHESHDNPPGQADTLHSLGHAHHQLGQYDEAMACYERGLGLLRHIGNRYNQTTVLTSIGDTQDAAGNHQAARDAWQQALDILEELHHPDAEKVRSRLATSR